MIPKRQSVDVHVYQDSLETIKRLNSRASLPRAPFFGTVIETYSDRMTCDIEDPDGVVIHNIPVFTRAGLVDGEVYGEVELPAVDDVVLIGWAGPGEREKMVIGTLIPYLTNEFTGDAVNSSSKSYTTKLLEADKPNDYRKIFKSGTTLHVEEDGTFTIETPSGTYIRIDEGASEVYIVDANGNDITMGSSSVTVNGNLEVLQ